MNKYYKIIFIFFLFATKQVSAQWIVNGTVNYSDGGNISSGQVYLLSKDFNGNNQIEAQGDIGIDGNYSIVVTNNVECLPIAIPDDELDFLPTGFPNCIMWNQAQVVSPSWNSPVNFECEKVLSNRPIQFGELLKVNGRVLSNNRVVNLSVLYFYNGGVFMGSAMSNERGEFSIQLPHGEYDVLVSSFKEKSITKEITINGHSSFEFHFLANENNNNNIESFILNQNYPNPFNPTTTIKFGMDFAAKVRVSILDSKGSEISVIKNEYLNAGIHEVLFKADYLPSGVYFYKIDNGRFSQTKKMVILK